MGATLSPVASAVVTDARPVATDGPILLYDGECGFCQASVQRVLDLDRPDRRRGPPLRFAPLQGTTAAPILARHGLTPGAAKGFGARGGSSASVTRGVIEEPAGRGPTKGPEARTRGSMAFDTMMLVEHPGAPRERLALYSDAVVAVTRYLGGPWAWLGLVLQLVPRPLRDAGYGLIAMNRLRLSRGVDACRVPRRDERARFLK